MSDFDVIVVGGGGAGLSAANMAAEEGARVLIVEADEQMGGSTRLSHGVFYAAGTKIQREAGIEDRPDAMFLYAMALNQYRTRPSLLRRYCDEGANTLHWLMEKGVEFPVDQLSSSGAYSEMSGVPRCHPAKGNGAAITYALETALQNHTVNIALKTRVQRLVKDKSGAVTGIESNGEIVTAGAVVVTTGGFGANDSLLEKYYPSAVRWGKEAWYIGSKHCVGDAIAFGEEVGADISGFDTGLVNVNSNLRQVLELPPAWLTIFNRDGFRFMNEAVGYGVQGGIVDKQPGSECYGIMDAKTFAQPPFDPRFADFIKAGFMETQWQRDLMDQALTDGRILRANTIAELANKVGARPEALEHTVKLQNQHCSEGKDRLFFKPKEFLWPIGEGPYYSATFHSNVICFTSTGLRIDENAQVLDHSGVPIPGLFSAGEASNGVLGERYIGSGSSIANVVTFGRIAGRSAAAHSFMQSDPI